MADAAYHRAWRAANKEKVNSRKRASYDANPEKERARSAESMARSYQNNPEHKERRKDNARSSALWVKYRLKLDEYDRILEFQGGVCAGCGEPPRKTRLAVDHDHKTGRIRGLLCWLCNRAIGILRDRSRTAARLGVYLAEPTAPAALGKEIYGLIGTAKTGKKKMVYGPPQEVAVTIGRKAK